MKQIAIVLLIFTIGALVVAFRSQTNFEDKSSGIQFFKGSWEEALAKAKKEDKLIFLDAYASWCGPCKAMKRKTFTDAKVGEHFNKYYVCVAIDMEEGEGPSLARKYAVDSYPSLMFLQPDGKFIGKAVGYHSPEELLNILKQFVGQ
ncbi:MAG: thioredoxin family protein [bacterium]|nr:thioredoxin family protein [bacterium]